MKQLIEIKSETSKGESVSLKTEITNKELKILEPIFKILNDFKPYTTEDGWQHINNFPLTPNKTKNEKSIDELYTFSQIQLNTLKKFLPQDTNHITDIDILYI